MNDSRHPRSATDSAPEQPTATESDVGAAAGSNDVAMALADVQARIRRHEASYGREPGSVRLLAVSKKKPADRIADALAAGQQAFGENYLDEALDKIDTPGLEAAEWHFIGAIQSRKCAAIAQRFHWVHSVDRLKVARKLAENRPSNLPLLNICIQVNIDDESSKSGVRIDEIGPLVDACTELPGVAVRGLMSIPAPVEAFEAQRAACRKLREQFERLAERCPRFDTLSMGMSDDLEAAIAEGSTMVRVGTALFGARDR